MSSTNLGDLKTNELGISQAAFGGLGSNMNETTASTAVASSLKTVESAVPHAAFDGAFEGPGSKMNETAASSYVANLPVEKLEELLAAKKAAAKNAEASTIMQSLDGEVGAADVIFSTPSRSKVTLHPTIADSPRCIPQQKSSPAPTKLSYHQHSIAEVRYAHEGKLPSNFPTGPWKDANENYIEHLIEDLAN